MELYMDLKSPACVQDSSGKQFSSVYYNKVMLKQITFQRYIILIYKLFFNLYSAMQPNNHPPYRFLFPGASAMISKAAISRNYCIGSLTIAHEHEMGNLEYVILKNKRSHYPNIQRGFPVLRRRAISYIQTTGDCCWEFYIKRHFQGERQLLFPGEDTFYPDFKPASIKKLKCTLN